LMSEQRSTSNRIGIAKLYLPEAFLSIIWHCHGQHIFDVHGLTLRQEIP
jgi:hypothetical protein